MINRSVLKNAKVLRNRMTRAEEILWEELRNNKLGVKFRRQAPFVFGAYKYIADFYCASKKLIIELDGNIHDDADIKEHDEFREDIFGEMAYKILRFSNEEVFDNLSEVINQINQLIK